ncbi:1-acyl-sn-glycerol-3-phosphate acyltransferase [Aureibaculum sp. A20]|uniref:1-acyl-sn-glycerol-3-phosphate acyltransferase n=1 Tax=Aureibaculum flavum TaxID=2795986 RepID=A0ABS0WPE1_9FLAO|nr:lysophospholipid acyltransferase family protein [Aureibaculum flavum]MBJ2173796.1 1-acyl-sn-glycerol-3-phosphate acyltransferase [Aureibaculum flavum]
MRKLLAYPLSVVYYLCFGLTLLIFHPILWISNNVFGYNSLKKSVDLFNFFLLRCLNVLGTRFTFTNPYDIEINQPLIIVSNHQSMYDISPIIWYMRKHHPKFISKAELGKGIPSISYNLRHGGSALIERKNPRQAITAIKEFSVSVVKNNWAAVIFPEGTRSKNGVPKDFQKRGLLTLFKEIPEATVVPISINNSWKTVRYGKFPMGIGTHMTITVHKPVKIATFTDKELLINEVETTIKNGVHP